MSVYDYEYSTFNLPINIVCVQDYEYSPFNLPINIVCVQDYEYSRKLNNIAKLFFIICTLVFILGYTVIILEY